MRKRSLPAVAVALLLATTSTGCFGKFAMTKKLLGWNDSVSNKFVRTFVFWGLMIIPAYEICFFADAVVFNLLEFWTGQNPVADASDVEVRPNADGSVAIGWQGKRWRIVPLLDDAFALEREGVVVARARLLDNGGLHLVGPRLGAWTLPPPGPDQGAVERALAARAEPVATAAARP